MWNALVCMDHFDGHAKGDIITDKEVIQTVRENHAHLVCKVYLPETPQVVTDSVPLA